MSLSECRLVARKGEERYIPKYGLERDIQYFDLDSLARMYGEAKVVQLLRSYEMSNNKEVREVSDG